MKKVAGFTVLTVLLAAGPTFSASGDASVNSGRPLQGKYSCRTPEPENQVAQVSQIEFSGSKVTLTRSAEDKQVTTDYVDNSSKLTSIERKMGLMLIEGTAEPEFSLETFQTKSGDLLIDSFDGLRNDRSEEYARGEVKLNFDYICSRMPN